LLVYGGGGVAVLLTVLASTVEVVVLFLDAALLDEWVLPRHYLPIWGLARPQILRLDLYINVPGLDWYWQ